jgi:dipeptidyl aminopeptidase/acylaminoacyl peptidase
MRTRSLQILILGLLTACIGTAQEQETATAPALGRQRITIRSTRDGSLQPSYIIVPPGYNPNGPAVPMVVALHTWNYTLEQRHQEFETGATQRNWIYLFPNFRGVDDHPEACGSDLAQQDVIDAVAWTRTHMKIDDKRIYLWGWSGGGHMALLMASRQPELWTAVSAWAGITDMAAYYREQDPGTDSQLRGCMGDAPGASAAVDAQYTARSPITNIARASSTPIDIWNGRDDSDVSPTHAIQAFNRLAAATGSSLISREEATQLTRPNGHLNRPQLSDQTIDTKLGREIFLRRTAGRSRITIYKGSHETIAAPTFEWFEKNVKP